MMRQGAVNAYSLIVLIFLVLATLILGFMAYGKHNEMIYRSTGEGEPGNVSRVPVPRLEAAIDEAETEREAWEEQLEAYQRAIDNQMMELIRRYHYYNNGRWNAYVVLDDNGAPMVDEEGNLVVQFGYPNEELGEPGTRYTTDDEITRDIMEAYAEMAISWRTAFAARQRHGFPELEEVREDFRAQTTAYSREAGEINQATVQANDRLGMELTQLEAERRQIEEDHRLEYSIRATRIVQLENEIRRLRRLELRFIEEVAPDGQILATNNATNTIQINLGSSDGLAQGMRFVVFNRENRAWVEKGWIEVTRAYPNYADARIVETVDDRRNPIAEGDLVGNPVFNPDRRIQFYLAGEFHIYNRGDLANFIRRAGGIVVDELQPGVDFIVTGARSDRDQERAREFEIMAMTEEFLVPYLHTTFRRDD